MTQVLFANVAGRPRGSPIHLPSRRRRLSTITRRHAPPDRRFIVSVHRRGELAFVPSDASVRLRRTWAKTLVGPHDVVLITVLPLGGGGGRGGGKALSIGLTLASIALVALAGPVGGMIGGAIGAAVQVGMVVGGLAFSFAAKAAAANGDKKNGNARSLYSLTGGGNTPKPGDRKPLLYGRCWSTPPLSQKDHITYEGDTMRLVKRMTLGLGRFDLHRVRIGDALFWEAGAGILPPFAGSSSIEFLYEQASALAPGDLILSPDVGGQELPRANGNPDSSPWFSATPPGVSADYLIVSWQFPAGLNGRDNRDRPIGVAGAISFEARQLDLVTGAVIGDPFPVLEFSTGLQQITMPVRQSSRIELPAPGRYQVRARNPFPLQDRIENRVTWDTMTAVRNDVRIRPKTTELVISVLAGKGMTVTAFSDVQVEATRVVPVWTGNAWEEQPTRKALWAYADLVRGEHGLNDPDGFDLDKALFYLEQLPANDEFNGALETGSSFWEASGDLLLPLRSQPVKVGAIHSFVRDESRAETRHTITRRQIVRDTSQAEYAFVQEEGDGGDVIVEFDWEGDPKRRDEVRFSVGPPTRTPRRIKPKGITNGTHALMLATWRAAIATFRGSTRKVTTEWDGRLIFPGSHILSDLWFLAGKQVVGVESSDGAVLTVDADLGELPPNPYVSIRNRHGREWGLLRCSKLGPRTLELNANDVLAVSATAGLSLAGALAEDTQDPTTVTIGALVELQETYVARSAIPSDENHVDIEMVLDDARVWQLLGETVQVPTPPEIEDKLGEPAVPVIRGVVHARANRIETTIEVIWSFQPARGASSYEAQVSYDAGVSWGDIYAGPLASGRGPLRQSDLPVSFRARGISRQTGLPGPWTNPVTFLTLAPLVPGSVLEDLSVAIEKMTAQTRREVESINRRGQEALDRYADPNQLEMRDAIQTLDERLADMAAANISEAVSSFEKTDRLDRKTDVQAVRIGRNSAAIQQETLTRISEDEALAQVSTVLEARLGQAEAAALIETLTRASQTEALAQTTTLLNSRLTTAEGGLVGQASALSSLTTRVTSTEGGLDALSQYSLTLNSRLTNAEGGLSGQATALSSLTTRVTSAEGNISAQSTYALGLNSRLTTAEGQVLGNASAVATLQTNVTYINGVLTSQASSLTALQATQGSHSSTLTVYGSAIAGYGVEFGITGYVDGVAGGLVITGVKRLDGGVAYNARLLGSLFVSGSITGDALAANNIITVSGQIGTLLVDNIHIKDRAITTTTPGVAPGEIVDVGATTRSGSVVTLIALWEGVPGTYYNIGGSNGTLSIFRDGQLLEEVGTNFATGVFGGTNKVAFLMTMCIGVDQAPPPGAHVYSAWLRNNSYGAGSATNISLLVLDTKG